MGGVVEKHDSIGNAGHKAKQGLVPSFAGKKKPAPATALHFLMTGRPNNPNATASVPSVSETSPVRPLRYRSTEEKPTVGSVIRGSTRVYLGGFYLDLIVFEAIVSGKWNIGLRLPLASAQRQPFNRAVRPEPLALRLGASPHE